MSDHELACVDAAIASYQEWAADAPYEDGGRATGPAPAAAGHIARWDDEAGVTVHVVPEAAYASVSIVMFFDDGKWWDPGEGWDWYDGGRICDACPAPPEGAPS